VFYKFALTKNEPRLAFTYGGRTSKSVLPPVRIAVAGAGRFAHQHLKVLASLQNVNLVGICNRRGGSDLSSVASQYGAHATFSDYEEMLDVAQPDGVFVVVSHSETVRVATSCLERRIPCLIEKPAGFTSEETAGLAEIAARHECLNLVGVNRRYWSVLHNALAIVLQHGPLFGILIEAPESIHRIRARAVHDPRLFDIWLIADTIHAIDLFRCLAGEVTELHALRTCWTERSGDSFTAIMRLSRNCLGTFTSHLHTGGEWSVTLSGNGVKAVVSLSAVSAQVHFDTGETFPVPVDPIDAQYKAGLYAQDLAFIHALACGERLTYPASDLADAAKTMRLIEEIGNLA
jgi:myo-inositol 2-dehydrogenase / D-chiro-inositol 1-dehydrogenase